MFIRLSYLLHVRSEIGNLTIPITVKNIAKNRNQKNSFKVNVSPSGDKVGNSRDFKFSKDFTRLHQTSRDFMTEVSAVSSLSDGL